MSSESTKQTFTGSCHCGYVKYKAALSLPNPPEQPQAGRCNCTICLKSGFTGVHLSEDDFTLISPSSRSEVSDYVFDSPDCHRYFCNKCGIHVFSKAKYEFEGTQFDTFGINLHSLDQPQPGIDVSTFKMRYWDGRNDNWQGGQKDVPWPGGCI